ncbi:MAG: hypothetical protein AABX30_00175 [Nanoarchaeota archaeon]
MNIQFLLEKLYSSPEFEKFKKEYEDAYPCSGFFIIDLKGTEKKYHLDFYSPSLNKMFSFYLENGIELIPVETLGEGIPERILLNYSLDFDDIVKIIKKEINEREIKKSIEKILISLQNINGKDLLICTVFISNLGIIKANITPEMEIIDFEKKSFFDFIRKA